MELSTRKLKILEAVIEEYAVTGTPVGSRNLSKKTELSLSAATIRNEMADLEELGYLEKAHASSGRRPNARAYRLYVDQLMRINPLSPEEMDQAKSYFSRRLTETSEVLDAAAKALSDLTAHIGLVSEPESDAVTLRRIQLVKVSDARAMAVFVTDTGLVRDTVMELPPMFPADELEQLSSYLSRELCDMPVREAAKKLKEIAGRSANGQKAVMDAVFEAINRSTDARQMHLGGKENIWRYPEYRDISKIRQFLSLLETKDSLATLLGQGSDLEFSIRIGSEITDAGLPDLSVVTATYRAGANQIGSFGIIGPIRMDYARVLSVLRCVGMSLSEVLSELMETGR